MVRTRSRSPRWRKSGYDHDPPYISNHWMDREQRHDQRRRAYAANARRQNDDQSPALKSALALLGLVGSLFGELALDVCALLCCVVVALCPWKWPAFKAAWRQATQSDRRFVRLRSRHAHLVGGHALTARSLQGSHRSGGGNRRCRCDPGAAVAAGPSVAPTSRFDMLPGNDPALASYPHATCV